MTSDEARALTNNPRQHYVDKLLKEIYEAICDDALHSETHSVVRLNNYGIEVRLDAIHFLMYKGYYVSFCKSDCDLLVVDWKE